MNLLDKILKTSTKSDPFGIDSAVTGIRQLKARIDQENRKLETLKAKLRDAALADPDGEIDEMPVLRQETRIRVFESALERATAEAGKSLDSQMPAIEEHVSALEVEQEAIRLLRDQQLLRTIRDFVDATEGRLTEMPRKGRGGVIQIPAVTSMDEAAVRAFFDETTAAPKQSEISKKLNDVVAHLHKLQMVRHLGGLQGIQSLAG